MSRSSFRGIQQRPRARRWIQSSTRFALTTSTAVLIVGAGLTNGASAAQPAVNLGKAAPFAVLAGTTITNTGSSTVSGSIGLNPGTAVTGFPPGLVSHGYTYTAGAFALGAKNALTAAYLDTAGRTPSTSVPMNLGGTTLVAGVYRNSSALSVTGTLTLNGQGDASSVFIFQTGSSLITASGSTVHLIGGAQACNVFWQVTSSATLGTASTFVGTVMALTSISVQTGATVAGRVLARNGEVSLDANVITHPACVTSSKIPKGSPGTGFGGSARTSKQGLFAGAVVLFSASIATAGVALRRRQRLAVTTL